MAVMVAPAIASIDVDARKVDVQRVKELLSVMLTSHRQRVAIDVTATGESASSTTSA